MSNNTPDLEQEKGMCHDFLQNFLDDRKQPKYYEIMKEIANRKEDKLVIEVDDLIMYFSEVHDSTVSKQAKVDRISSKPNGALKKKFVHNVETNTKRYIKLFAEAADCLLPKPDDDAAPGDVFDELLRQKRERDQKNNPRTDNKDGTQPEAQPAREEDKKEEDRPAGDLGQLPAALLRRFHVFILPSKEQELQHLRRIGAQDVGRIVKVRGQVTQVTDVKPVVEVVTYIDPDSGYEVYQEVNGRTFVPLKQAPPRVKSQAIEPLIMQTKGSKFVRFQEARIQEMTDEVPTGATPRTMTVRMLGSLTRKVKAGDEVILSAIFLPEPATGFRALRAGLVTSTYLEAQAIQQVKLSYAQHIRSQEDDRQLADIVEQGNVYNRLASSIAPEIFGHEDVKKALLLQMVGGSDRDLQDGMKMRGDIHICLMGDPGVAKSQLLKFVSRISPRGVYTTGRGSSGVGLTAAVMRDPVTKEMVLEGGALVLADKGICCIDEFDKMDEVDRTAIHEVMEQQTVSIAKAGITTTLNTRTSVLAAANPAYSRYDKRKSAAENINMPAALLSRFDILWLILDKVDEDKDKKLAQHIINVHRTCKACPEEPDSQTQDPSTIPLPASLLRTYIAEAKSHHASIPESLTDYIAEVYADMRALEKQEMGQSGTYTTARTLMSILRLSQSLAKLKFCEEVEQADIDEALRLMEMSKSSLREDDGSQPREDPISMIYRDIRKLAQMRRGATIEPEVVVTWADIMNSVGNKPGITIDMIRQCLEEYKAISVWRVTENTPTPNVMIPVDDL